VEHSRESWNTLAKFFKKGIAILAIGGHQAYINSIAKLYEIDDARIYGGVHNRLDQESAALQGKSVGANILRHELRPVHRRTGKDSGK
jgi:hypothetical protein